MAATMISDVIVPEVFNPYVIQRTMALSALVQSGIMAGSAEFDTLASSESKVVNMPFWADLTGEDEVLSDAGALTPGKIGSDKDMAVILRRGNAWGVNDLAAQLAGDDPMRAIADLVAAYWARRLQAIGISTLTGVFGAASMAGNLHDISALAGALAVIGAGTMADARQKLGDAKDQLTGIAMHSDTETKLEKDDLIDTIKGSEGGETIKVYGGKRVIIDDTCPVAGGVYTTYLFGPGALALGNGNPTRFTPTETARDSLAGEDYLINRKTLIVHPRGVAFQSAAVVGSSPTNAELATAANWARVWENKAIRIVAFKHKLA